MVTLVPFGCKNRELMTPSNSSINMAMYRVRQICQEGQSGDAEGKSLVLLFVIRNLEFSFHLNVIEEVSYFSRIPYIKKTRTGKVARRNLGSSIKMFFFRINP